MYPILFEFGEIHIGGYAIAFLMAVIAGSLVFSLQLLKNKVKLDSIALPIIIIYCFLFSLVCAVFWDKLAHLIGGEPPGSGGISFLGGIVFGIPVFCAIMFALYPSDTARYILNALVPAITIGHAFGRIGCLLGGCCYGKPSKIGLGFIYPEGSKAFEIYGKTRLIPIQLYESVFLIALTVVFLTVVRQRRLVFYGYFYATYRFIAEFFRGDNRGAFLPFLSPSQFLSLIMILVSTIILIVQHTRGDNGKLQTALQSICTKKQLQKKSIEKLQCLSQRKEPDGASVPKDPSGGR